MGPLALLRSVYDPDTLDTRFTTPATIPYKTFVDAQNDPVAGKDYTAVTKASAKPSKWRTLEYRLYFVVLAMAIPYMFWVAFEVSRPSDPRWHNFDYILDKGWIPGRMIDVTDAQYRVFRGNLLPMTLLLIFHPLVRKGWNAVFPLKPPASISNPKLAQGAARLQQRASFDFVFALIYLTALHGVSMFKIIFILWVNYQLAMNLPRSKVPFATWIFNVGMLFANDLADGYKFKTAAALFSPAPPPGVELGEDASFLMQWATWLDSMQGLLPRWQVSFNICVLRLISFNLDWYWSQDRGHVNSIEKQLDVANLSEKDRVAIPADNDDFSFRNYIAYAMYAPLYIAGPILTFNDYISQAKFKSATIATGRTIRYGVRFLLVLLAMEVILHFNYVCAISLAYPDWSTYTPAQLSILSFLNLHIIWLKLLLPWRLFRLWALIDGVDPPENMVRCVSDNFSPRLFWRAWHRSYNRWLIRYIFVPLGGASFTTWRSSVRTMLTFTLVFTFVALWHDIKLRLLVWGWLIVLFFIPEIVGKYLFPAKRFQGMETLYRMLCGAGAVCNVLMMITANLVGFAVGVDGLREIVKGIFHEFSGFLFLLGASAGLFVGIQVMFEVRESEKRRGIDMKC